MTSPLHDFLAAAAQRGAVAVREVAEATGTELSAFEDDARVYARLKARGEADARALLLLPEVAAALEPFAKYAEARGSQPISGLADEIHTIHFRGASATLTVEDCRRAAKALASLSAVASADGAGEAERG